MWDYLLVFIQANLPKIELPSNFIELVNDFLDESSSSIETSISQSINHLTNGEFNQSII